MVLHKVLALIYKGEDKLCEKIKFLFSHCRYLILDTFAFTADMAM